MRALILSLALASQLPLAASAAEPRSDSVAVAVGVNATVITPHTIAVRVTHAWEASPTETATGVQSFEPMEAPGRGPYAAYNSILKKNPATRESVTLWVIDEAQRYYTLRVTYERVPCRDTRNNGVDDSVCALRIDGRILPFYMQGDEQGAFEVGDQVFLRSEGTEQPVITELEAASVSVAIGAGRENVAVGGQR